MIVMKIKNTTLPGPITFIRGLEEFDMMFSGHILSELDKDVYIEWLTREGG